MRQSAAVGLPVNQWATLVSTHVADRVVLRIMWAQSVVKLKNVVAEDPNVLHKE